MICPSCHTQQIVTAQNFGALYTCKTCQAVYFLDFSGEPLFDDQAPNEEQSLAAEPPPPAYEPLPVEVLQRAEPTPFESVSTPVENSFVTFDENQMYTPPEELSAVPEALNSFSDIAKDISDYGNTETQIAHLNYDLRVSGLDTAEIKMLLKEAIEDSRFGWDVSEMMRNIKNGEIQFLKLNPVKAYVLAKRLQFLDVEKVWIQHAVG